MDSDAASLVLGKQGLGEDELLQVRKLQEICNEHEGLDIPVNLEKTSVSNDEKNQFLYTGNNRELIGFLSFVGGGLRIEVGLMVHPEHRRKGVGNALLAAAKDECKRRGVREWLIVCERSQSGQAFVQAIGAKYRFSEYRMKFEDNRTTEPQPEQSPLRIQRADINDLENLVRLTAISFGESEDKVRQRMTTEIQSSKHRFYICRLRNEPIGSLGVVSFDNRDYIIAFGVHPSFRGRGYGRRMLLWVLETLLAANRKEIFIEVETENRNALALYRSCGFKELTAYGYYHMNL